MKKLICLILALAMLTAVLSGCGEKKKLLGTWECTLDLSAAIQQVLYEKELGADFEVSGFAVTAQLTFLEDSTFRLQLDQDKLTAAFDKLLEDMEAGLIDMLQSQLTEKGLNITTQELLALSGLEMDDLTEQLHQSFEEEGLLEDLSEQAALEGFYQVKGDRLFFGADAEAIDDSIYTSYSADKDTLILAEQVGVNMFLEGNLILGVMPISFTKAA